MSHSESDDARTTAAVETADPTAWGPLVRPAAKLIFRWAAVCETGCSNNGIAKRLASDRKRIGKVLSGKRSDIRGRHIDFAEAREGALI